ncbi:2-trimethylaminoethylphosphonate dioxygenase [Hwanghaeella sp.]|uniref:2-trimethylaminoethylphosphonate dioxygenase n=1 Tax=Hwanghaeella sp. TaxID=2605943 RepID=UPI003CCBA1BB
MHHITTIVTGREWATLTWSDGLTQSLYAPWLRDNAQDSQTVHPGNGQRLIDIADLPENAAFRSATLSTDGSLAITFDPDGHESVYPASWLRGFAAPAQDPYGPRLWPTGFTVARFEYGKIIADRDTERNWLTAIARDGIALVTDAPVEPETVCAIAENFGFVRETNYGRLFDVRSVENPTNMAFTSAGLMVHTDNPYRDPVPGLQLLHCLQNETDGGGSLFVDGFQVADRLRRDDPEAFRILSTTWLPFRFHDATVDLQARAPMITVDDKGRVVTIRYNNRSIAPADLSAADLPAFYDAYRKFSHYLRNPEVEATLRLAPGDCVVFDNMRVLHGRKGFAPGKRWLQGCYADKDAVYGRLRIGDDKTVQQM